MLLVCQTLLQMTVHCCPYLPQLADTFCFVSCTVFYNLVQSVLSRRGGKIYRLLIPYCLQNIFAKSY